MKFNPWLMLTRYISALLISINGLFIIYFIMGPITYFLSLWALSLLGSTQGYFLENLIIFNGVGIELVEACIAGAAHYLLIFLNLSIPMKAEKRLKTLSFSIVLFLLINVIRIVIFSILAANGSSYFDSLHLLFWYTLSIVMVMGVWFSTVRIFKIEEIPIYTDFKRLLQLMSNPFHKERSKRN